MRLYTIAEIARLLGVTRQAIYKKVINGRIPAQKAGRTYVIAEKDLQVFLGKELSEADKAFNQKAIDLIFKYYGNTLKKLAKV